CVDRPGAERLAAPGGAREGRGTAGGGHGMTRLRVFLGGLVAVAAGLLGLFAYQLSQPKNDFVQSAMIGKPTPGFTSPAVVSRGPGWRWGQGVGAGRRTA